MLINPRFINGRPPEDGKYYVLKNGEYIAIPEAWAPSIRSGQRLVLVLNEEMDSYTVTGENIAINDPVKSPVLNVYACACTGTTPPAEHDGSDVFFNTSDGTVQIYDDGAWGSAEAAGDKKFLSITDGRLYFVAGESVVVETPDEDTLYFAVLNGRMFYYHGGKLYFFGGTTVSS